MLWLAEDRTQTGASPLESSTISRHRERHVGRLYARARFGVQTEETEEVGIGGWVEYDLGCVRMRIPMTLRAEPTHKSTVSMMTTGERGAFNSQLH